MTTLNPISDYGEEWMLYITLLQKSETYRLPYLSLHTENPTEANIVETEVTGGGYSRMPILENNFQLNSEGLYANTMPISFPEATADWGTITYVGIKTDVTAGQLSLYGQLTRENNIQTGDVFEIGVGHLRIYFYGDISTDTRNTAYKFFLQRGWAIFFTPTSYIGLLTDSGEVSGKGYQRMPIVRSWNPLQEASEGHYTYNVPTLTSNKATADWGNITRVGIYTSEFEPTYTYMGNLLYPQYVSAGDRFRFKPTKLRVSVY